MAEFSKVAREYNRMCISFVDNCENCRINPYEGNNIFACRNNVIKHPEKYESLIMQWAAEHPAEHPDPMYPSVAKYLEQFGIYIRRDGSLQADFFKVNKPMSADIAQKLGIKPNEPKEGV